MGAADGRREFVLDAPRPEATEWMTVGAVWAPRRIGDRVYRLATEVLADNAQAPASAVSEGKPAETSTVYDRGHTSIPALPFCHARLSARKPSLYDFKSEPQTWGDRIRRRRLELGLLQRDAAEQIGCSTSSVTSWERNRAKPKVSEVPRIIRFLGYAPVDASEPWSARLTRARQALGLSRKRLAAPLGVDESTVKRWEDGTGRPSARLEEWLRDLLSRADPAGLGRSAWDGSD